MPNTRPTDQVEPAWSTGDDFGNDFGDDQHEEEPQDAAVGQSWSATLRIAGLLVVAGLVLAGAIVLGRWLLTPGNSPTKAASPSASSAAPATSAATGPPLSITSAPGQDDRYIQTLNDKGITFDKRENAIANGKQICQDLSKGVPKSEEVGAFRKQVQQDNASLAARAAEYVDISIQAYCPQYAH